MDYHFDSKEDVKLIILTVINNFNIPINHSVIADTVLTHSFAEYIDIMQHLYELTESGMVTYYVEDGAKFYSLTQKGKDTVGYFSSKIPFTVRERLFETAKKKSREFLNEQSIKAEYLAHNDFEFGVTLRIVERGVDMFRLEITVSSEEIAKTMCAKFRRDPEGFYANVFTLLASDDNENKS